MAGVVTETKETPTGTTQRENMLHVVCTTCHPRPPYFGMCGTPINVFHGELNDDTDCVVCADMEFEPCPGCGT